MKKFYSSLSIAAATALGLVASSGLAADDTTTVTSSASVEIVAPLVAAEKQAMSFGKIIKPSSGNGTITISTDGSTTTSGVTILDSSGIQQAVVEFTSGTAGETVALSISATDADSTNIKWTGLSYAYGTESGSSSSGSLSDTGVTLQDGEDINIGGTLQVSSSATAGAYDMDLTITATYE